MPFWEEHKHAATASPVLRPVGVSRAGAQWAAPQRYTKAPTRKVDLYVGPDANVELRIMRKDEKDMEKAMDSSMLHTLGSSMAFGLGFGAVVVLFAHMRKAVGRRRRADGAGYAATAPSAGSKAHDQYERSDEDEQGSAGSLESSRLLSSGDTRQFPSVTRRKSVDRYEEF